MMRSCVVPQTAPPSPRNTAVATLATKQSSCRPRTSPACPHPPAHSLPPQSRGRAGQTAEQDREDRCTHLLRGSPTAVTRSSSRTTPHAQADICWLGAPAKAPAAQIASHPRTLALSPEVLPQWPPCRVLSLARMPMEGRTPRRRAADSSRSSSLQGGFGKNSITNSKEQVCLVKATPWTGRLAACTHLRHSALHSAHASAPPLLPQLWPRALRCCSLCKPCLCPPHQPVLLHDHHGVHAELAAVQHLRQQRQQQSVGNRNCTASGGGRTAAQYNEAAASM